MANDIMFAISDQPIKNGTMIISSCPRTGYFDKKDTYVKNTPIMADIEAKFDARFDNPSYYYGGGAGCDGGDVGDVLGV